MMKKLVNSNDENSEQKAAESSRIGDSKQDSRMQEDSHSGEKRNFKPTVQGLAN